MATAPAPWDSDPVVSGAQPAPAVSASPDAPWESDPTVQTGGTRTITQINGKPLPHPIEVPVDASDEDVRRIALQHGLQVDPNSVVLNSQQQPQESLADQILDNAKNDVAGIAQGVAALPDMAAGAAGKIMSIIPNLIGHALELGGHTDAAKWIQDTVTHNLANPVQLGDVVEKVAPTPDTTSGHVNRLVGQLVGSAAAFPQETVENAVTSLVGDAPKAVVEPAAVATGASPDAAPDYVKLARDLNIRRTPATASRTGVATVAQSGLGALPGGTPVAAGTAREISDLGNAAKGVAESVGNVSSRQGAGEAVAEGAQEYAANSKTEGKSLYAQRDQLIGGPKTPVPTDQTKAALDDISSRFPTSPAIEQLREHPAIRAIADALPDESGQPLTLGEVTEALSHVRGVVRNLSAQTLNGKATAPVLSRVKQVEQGLEDDVVNAARNADIAAGRTPGAPGSAVAAQQQADAFWADRSAALNGSLKRPLQSAADDTKVSGEAVYNQVANDMDAKSGNLARLRDTWFRLPDEAKSTFAATKIDDLGRASPGNQNDLGNAWSFQNFLTNLNKLSPQARNIVFGPKADTQLQQIATYANRLRQLDRARNFSNTAKNYFAGAFMATVGGAVMHGDLGTAAEAAMALPATWGGAKLLLSSPAMRDWTAQAMKAMTLGNGANREVALKVLTAKLSRVAATSPAVAAQAKGLQEAITNAANENLHAAAASTGSQQPNSQN